MRRVTSIPAWILALSFTLIPAMARADSFYKITPEQELQFDRLGPNGIVILNTRFDKGFKADLRTITEPLQKTFLEVEKALADRFNKKDITRKQAAEFLSNMLDFAKKTKVSLFGPNCADFLKKQDSKDVNAFLGLFKNVNGSTPGKKAFDTMVAIQMKEVPAQTKEQTQEDARKTVCQLQDKSGLVTFDANTAKLCGAFQAKSSNSGVLQADDLLGGNGKVVDLPRIEHKEVAKAGAQPVKAGPRPEAGTLSDAGAPDAPAPN